MDDKKVAVVGKHELAGREVGDGVLGVGDPHGSELGHRVEPNPEVPFGSAVSVGLSEKLLRPVWKKPSANLPLLDTSVSPPARPWVGKRLSAVAA